MLGGAIDAPDVLELLNHLVEKSLVFVVADSERYDALETVRQYMQDHLDEAADGALRNRHLAHYVALGEKAMPDLLGPNPASAIARIDADQQNLVAALTWPGCDAHDAELALRLVRIVVHIFSHTAPYANRYRMMAEVIARPMAAAQNEFRRRALGAAAQFAILMGFYQEGQALAEESLSIAQALGDRSGSAIAQQLLGMAFSDQGDRKSAQRHFSESLNIVRELGPPRRLSAVLQNMGKWHRDGGEADLALPLLEESIAVARAESDRGYNTAVALCSLADILLHRGDDVRGAQLLRDASEIATGMSSLWINHLVLDGTAVLATKRGEHDLAVHLFGAAERVLAQTALRRDVPLDPALHQSLAEAARAAAASDSPPNYDDAMAQARAWLARALDHEDASAR